jgi:hypothetical protein
MADSKQTAVTSLCHADAAEHERNAPLHGVPPAGAMLGGAPQWEHLNMSGPNGKRPVSYPNTNTHRTALLQDQDTMNKRNKRKSGSDQLEPFDPSGRPDKFQYVGEFDAHGTRQPLDKVVEDPRSATQTDEGRSQDQECSTKRTPSPLSPERAAFSDNDVSPLHDSSKTATASHGGGQPSGRVPMSPTKFGTEKFQTQRIAIHVGENWESRQPKPGTTTMDSSAHTDSNAEAEEIQKSTVSKWSKYGRIIEESKMKILQRQWVCATCSVPMSSIKEMEKHADGPFNCSPFKCPKCADYNSCFKKYEEWHRHCKSHKSDKPFSCEFCGRKGPDGWDRKDRLDTHIENNHPREWERIKKEYPKFCTVPDCMHARTEKSFKTESKYLSHMRKEHGYGKLNCDVPDCNRTGKRGFAHPGSLEAHRMRDHS